MAGFSLGGAGSGALTGGSLLGAPGAIAGGLFGGLFGGGKKDKLKKIDTMTKEQKQLLNQLTQLLSGPLGQANQQALAYQQDLLDPSSEAYDRFAQPYLDQFNEQTIPQLGERFAGAGANSGALSSSGFGQSLSAAGASLSNQLAAMKQGLMSQAASNIQGQYGGLLGQGLGAQPFGYQKPQIGGAQGFFNQWSSQGMPGLDKLLNLFGA